MYDQIINELRIAYDSSAEKRDQTPKSSWKIEARQAFLDLLQRENKRSLLEIGAGTGTDGKFFHDNGLEVTCTDLSPQMIRLCQAKGLTAHVMDFLNLDFPAHHFDAVYALNCLLHVPKTDLPRVLGVIQRVMKPGGLAFMAVYGGIESEGIWEDDYHDPKRFFAFYTDEQIKAIATRHFHLEDFKTGEKKLESDVHSQQLILRRGNAT